MAREVLSPSDLARLLERTSRTFALAIPLLEEPLARQVGVSYLLFRIADTLEDAPAWRRDVRGRALASFASWLDGARDASERERERERGREWKELVAARPPSDDAGCLGLLTRADDVLAAARSMEERVAHAVLHHTRRTARGMGEFVAKQDEAGALVLGHLSDLRRYAYVVAGIVGELLTDLFALANANVARERARLDADASAFGEGLQLVNILKDASADAREGRSYLPASVSRAEVISLARADLFQASRYVRTLAEAGAPAGAVAFCDLPVRLAQATLDSLERGAAKLAREDVMRIYSELAGRQP